MQTKEIKITTEYIKLDQLIKFIGIAQSGGHAKEIIADGIVLVNGEVCLMRGKKIKPEDIVEIEEEKYIIK
ncbi:MAG: RNA-binding S4 domain-containing protein [Oscillospiraceae bacterium]